MQNIRPQSVGICGRIANKTDGSGPNAAISLIDEIEENTKTNEANDYLPC